MLWDRRQPSGACIDFGGLPTRVAIRNAPQRERAFSPPDLPWLEELSIRIVVDQQRVDIGNANRPAHVPLDRPACEDSGGREQSLLLAELCAREMNHLPLKDALGLLALYAAEPDPKYERAAARWLGRLAFEEPELSLAEVQFAAAALAALPTREETAMRVLLDLIR